jgi:alkylhydroperoxidase/carboxymuconolactone decarboxylase family protein YurZ
MAGTNPAAMRRYNPSRRGRTSVKQLPSVWFDHRTDLPDWVTIRIGRILVEWSVLERELEELIQLLINTDIAFSRIMTNRMNAQTRISTAYSLIEWYVYHGRLNASFLKDFERIGNRIKNDTQNKRDIVAHGLWSRINGDWEVLKLRGRRETPELKPELRRLSRAFLPQREVITRKKLDKTVREIVTAARAVSAFRKRFYRARPPEQFKYLPAKYTRRRRRLSRSRRA